MAVNQSGCFFEISADGTWQPVIVTANCDWVYLKTEDSTVAIEDKLDNPLPIGIAFAADGTGGRSSQSAEIAGPFVTGAIACYAKAESGKTITVNGLVARL